jgi:hypothetical protein
MWHLLEPIHALVYFAPEVQDALRGLGMMGFWMGYFAGRAAPLGPVPAPVVTATFFNFRASMVERAIPAAWEIAAPAEIVPVRTAAAARALANVVTTPLGEAVALARRAVAGCRVDGRALFAAHLALPWPDDDVAAVWQAATLLREHRGVGHVAAWTAAGFTGLDAHVAMAATGAVPRATIQPNRGWSDEEWAAAEERALGRDLAAARREIEATTDRLAMEPWDHLGPDDTARLGGLLRPVVTSIAAARVVPYPNPMGLPPPAATS